MPAVDIASDALEDLQATIYRAVGMSAGLLAAVQLYFPAANLNLQFTTFGRLRPLHTNGRAPATRLTSLTTQ